MQVRSLSTAFQRTAVATARSPESVLFESEHKLTENPAGGWLLHLPNATVPMRQKPRWLKTQEQLNLILTQSSEPSALRAAHDKLEETAQRAYNATDLSFDSGSLKLAVSRVEPQLRPALKEMFSLKLEAESQSTHRVGGAMAGARCSQMRIFTEILGVL